MTDCLRLNDVNFIGFTSMNDDEMLLLDGGSLGDALFLAAGTMIIAAGVGITMVGVGLAATGVGVGPGIGVAVAGVSAIGAGVEIINSVTAPHRR